MRMGKETLAYLKFKGARLQVVKGRLARRATRLDGRTAWRYTLTVEEPDGPVHGILVAETRQEALDKLERLRRDYCFRQLGKIIFNEHPETVRQKKREEILRCANLL